MGFTRCELWIVDDHCVRPFKLSGPAHPAHGWASKNTALTFVFRIFGCTTQFMGDYVHP